MSVVSNKHYADVQFLYLWIIYYFQNLWLFLLYFSLP